MGSESEPAALADIRSEIWGANRRNLTIGMLLTVSMTAFEALAVATVMPAVVEDVGGLDWYGWVFSGFMLANLVSISIAGRTADRRGVAPPFVVGCGLFLLGLGCAGLAPSMPLIVVSRVAQGLGAGAISSAAYVAIAVGYSPAARPRMLAMLSSAWVVPGVIGPAIAAVIAEHSSWRWVFGGLTLPTVAAAWLATPSLRRLTPTTTDAGRPAAGWAALRLALAAGIAMAGLMIDRLLAGVASVALGIALGMPALRQILPEGTLRAEPGLPAAVATAGILGFTFFAAEAFLPLCLTEIRGSSTLFAGVTLTAATITWSAGAWIQERLAPNTSRRRLTVSGLLLLVIGIAGIATLAFESTPLAVAFVAWGVAGCGMGLAFTTASLVVLELAPPGNEGAASSAAQLANVLGTALGTGLGGAIIAWSARSSPPSTGVAMVLIDAIAITVGSAGLLAAARLPHRPGSSAPPAPPR